VRGDVNFQMNALPPWFPVDDVVRFKGANPVSRRKVCEELAQDVSWDDGGCKLFK